VEVGADERAACEGLAPQIETRLVACGFESHELAVYGQK
jgi:hypothetical protein